MEKLTKPMRLVLEELFEAEINTAISGRISPIVQRKPSKLVSKMLEEELIQEVSEVLPGRFPVEIRGYVLTERGRYFYCQWAGEQTGDEE